uniref:Uncharacterized protein n=1 Tax=Rhizophagus irregularis (strain DAOM 181602 / DAOM 197198 / MUCL 43194) TaxID=747089 RepID=U9UBW7_RHIID
MEPVSTYNNNRTIETTCAYYKEYSNLKFDVGHYVKPYIFNTPSAQSHSPTVFKQLAHLPEKRIDHDMIDLSKVMINLKTPSHYYFVGRKIGFEELKNATN